MYRLPLSILLLTLLITLGCAGHSSRYSHQQIEPCQRFPCGAEIISDGAILNYTIAREPSGECVLSGTLMPRGVAEGTQVDMAVLSFELARDITIFDSFSFPIVSRDMRVPLAFTKRFTPSGGFDGIIFSWDIRYVQ